MNSKLNNCHESCMIFFFLNLRIDTVSPNKITRYSRVTIFSYTPNRRHSSNFPGPTCSVKGAIDRGSYYNITAPKSARFHPRRRHCVFASDSDVQVLTKVEAKHANCSVFGCTDEHRTLLSQPQRRRQSSGFIDLFTVYYAAATQS